MEKLHTRCTLAQESKDQLEKTLQEKVSVLHEKDQQILSLTEEVCGMRILYEYWIIQCCSSQKASTFMEIKSLQEQLSRAMHNITVLETTTAQLQEEVNLFSAVKSLINKKENTSK